MNRLLLTAYFFEVGVILVVAPWSTFWDLNYFSESLPLLQTLARNNFVRGAVSGIGVLNLAAGVADLRSLLPWSRRWGLRTPAALWNPPPTLLCLVTPGTPLPFSVPTPDDRVPVLVALVEAAIGAGIDLIQIREPDLSARALGAIVEAAVQASRGTSTRVVVNDRLDVALSCGADGVHLGARSLPVVRARQITPSGFLVGRSIHTVREAEEAAAEGAADYLIAGTVFPSASKPGETRLLAAQGLAAVVRAAGAIPVLAIGGMDLDAIPTVAAAGARGFAAIRFFSEAAAGSRLNETVERARATFDTARAIP